MRTRKPEGVWRSAAILILAVAVPAAPREWPESKMASAYALGARRPYSPPGGLVHPQPAFCSGWETRLEIRQRLARLPQHDVDLGRTTVSVRARPSGRILCRETFAEAWNCLGFNRSTRRYILASINEHGVKVTLRGLVYFDERRATFLDSAFAASGLEAVASLMSPGKSWLALIGTTAERDRAGLFVLDIARDRLILLGDPPAPPPRPDLSDPFSIELSGAWEAPGRHYLELDAGIWAFGGDHTLTVSYGPDTLQARAGKRISRSWELSGL